MYTCCSSKNWLRNFRRAISSDMSPESQYSITMVTIFDDARMTSRYLAARAGATGQRGARGARGRCACVCVCVHV